MGAFPENDLEQRLLAASKGELNLATWIGEFLASSALVPVRGTDEAGDGFPVMTLDGEPYVPVFTSPGQLEKAAPGSEWVSRPVAALVESMPETMGLAINPGGDVGLPLAAEPLRRAIVPTGTQSWDPRGL